MKIISAYATNFGSYRKLNFTFEKGLTLIHGATGSGKSTICDLVPWTLFGITSKDGTVDEIVNWSPDGRSTTSTITFADGMTVYRSRKPNDLWFTLSDGVIWRGKDLIDTQKLINQQLGLTAETYLASAYFHEFSPTAQFFTSSAKQRRQICEQLVDLSLAKRLQESTKTQLKETTSQLKDSSRWIDTANNNLENAWKSYKTIQEKADNWSHGLTETDKLRLSKESELSLTLQAFEKEIENHLTKIASLKAAKCEVCGAPKKTDKIFTLQKNIDILQTKILGINKELTYIEGIKRLPTVNPYTEHAEAIKNQLKTVDEQIELRELERNKLTECAGDLEVLETALNAFRSRILESTVDRLQAETNRLLTEYFDAEINVTFSATSVDKIDVSIQKDGFQASYTQLSKGQRCLLKLCFGISVMKQTANQSGKSVDCVFFDEALSGLDEDLKAKSTRLFRQLSVDYGSVYVIEHSDVFKETVDNKLEVRLTEEGSKIGSI